MKRRSYLALVVVGLLVAATSPLFAHHSWPVNFSKAITVVGTVTSYSWGNPHVMMVLDVKGSNGAMEKWEVGGPSTTRMERNGWSRSTLKFGDVITATGFQFADGQKVLRLEKVVMADGKEMLLYGTR